MWLPHRVFPSLRPLSLPVPSTSLLLRPPSSREVHFWFADPDRLKDASLHDHYMGIISPSEKGKVLSIKENRAQRSALMSRVLVRATLSRYTDFKVHPGLLKFKKNKYGKPEVDWQHDDGGWVPPYLLFNVSHTASLVACGVTVNSQIGIDIEEKQRELRSDVISLVRRYFSSDEIEYLHAFSDTECRRQEFIRLWTLKEAYVKAHGRGFSASPFKTFTIRLHAREEGRRVPKASLADGAGIVVVDPACNGTPSPDWRFAQFELDGSHVAAICTQDAGVDDNIEEEGMTLKAWRTLPLVEDELVTGTDAIRNISGLSPFLNC